MLFEDPNPRIVPWETTVLPAELATATSPDATALVLMSTPPNITASPSAQFLLGGWSSHNFQWRLNGGNWSHSMDSPTVTLTVAPGQHHTFEARAVALGRPGSAQPAVAPLFHKWGVLPEGDASAQVQLHFLSDGPHRLWVKAVVGGHEDPGNATYGWTVDTQGIAVCLATEVPPVGALLPVFCVLRYLPWPSTPLGWWPLFRGL